jgi:Ca2+-binding EF-hand superfamily protein
MFLTTQELTQVFKAFDHNGDKQIHYREFIETLRQDVNDKRLGAVKVAFEFLSSQGVTSVDQLMEQYNAANHPRVRTREKSAETVRQEFHEAFLQRCAGGFTEEAFIDYYADLNACLPAEKDEYFVDIVMSTWNMTQDTGSYITPERVEELQSIIFEKVRQRTHGADDEGKTVKKLFRHFDLNGNGVISFEEFYQVLDALGCVFKETEIRALFQKYDKDNSGKLDYEEFSGFIALMGSGDNPNVNPVFAIEREKPDQVLTKIRETLVKRGAHGIRGIGRVFRRMDDSGDRKLDRMELMWGLKENGHDLSAAEFERIFKYFDRNNVGKINYDDFLRAMRGEMNDYRVSLVKLAFDKLDRTGDGIVNIDDLKIAYNVEKHPKYISGEMSATEILNEFMEQWDTIDRDGTVHFNEFVEYYNDVSASIDRDDYFELMIRNAWHIPGGEGWTANTTIPRHLEIGPDGK